MAKAAISKKPIFIAGVFDDLRAMAGEGTTGPLRVLLADIDEDPNQPRTVFDPEQLEQLAETIRLLGVMQPIGVRPAVHGRHVLVFGARRLRASKLAGVADIPVVIVPEDQIGLAAQVIENQSRAQLSNSDLAAAVLRFAADGMKARQIAVVCSLPEYLVKMFRSAERLPSFLAARIDDGDMRAIYELLIAWQRAPAEIERAMDSHTGPLSVTEARRIIENATGKVTSSVYLNGEAGFLKKEGQEGGSEQDDRPKSSVGFVSTAAVPDSRKGPAHGRQTAELAPTPIAGAAKPVSPSRPVFVMALPDGRRGVLVTHKRGSGEGRVVLDLQGTEMDVSFDALQPLAVE